MKQIYTLAIALMISLGVFAQKEALIMETFDSGTMPPTGWTIDASASNWSANSSANAGGEAPEARLSWSPQFNGTTRLISPAIDLTGETAVAISLKHFHDTYSPGGNELGIATTSSASGTWSTVWSVTTGANNIGPEDILVVVNNGDVGQADFQFCVYFDGDSYNMDYWYIDNIQLYVPQQLDMANIGITVPSYSNQSVDLDITGNIINWGLDDINSADVSWQIDGGTVYTSSYSGLSLSTGDVYAYTSDDQYTTTVGDHELKVWVSNINGGDDDDQSNDTLIKTLHIASQTVENYPIFEEFTSSTCGPCASFNSSTLTPFLESHEGELSIVKYQMDWPGSGDPYYTEEGGVRRAYYGVSYVPYFVAGGFPYSTDGTGVNAGFNDQVAEDAFILLNAEHSIDSVAQTAQVVAEITPYFNGSNFTMHAVVIEKVTTGNVASNGETEFHYVMMKMVPDASGTDLTFEDGVLQTITINADMSETNVEEWSDLEVVVFIQNEENKNIFQSAWSVANNAPPTPTATFNPSDGTTDVAVDTDITITFSQSMRLLDDSPITASNIADFVTVMESSNSFTFTASIDASNQVITITPDENLPYETSINVTVAADAIENENDMAYAGGNATFTTEPSGIHNTNANAIEMYPNPANETVQFDNLKGAEIAIYDVLGNKVVEFICSSNKEQVDVSNLPVGTYLVKVLINSNLSSSKLTIIE